ncbi:hypothetical protein XH94_06295 [Bradyrhizobium zhanjiangense]|uniref:Uncharacterized protein n=1 Tax=Bradyrhizobium zhanjiangense TaxID=1325107 RepID=A0A4Q0SPD7_9BRAD|nr:hypothetical protein XH94_06295 [Bradyrhizobium zhanjiangense]
MGRYALDQARNLLGPTEHDASINQLHGLTKQWLESVSAQILSERDETRDPRANYGPSRTRYCGTQ